MNKTFDERITELEKDVQYLKEQIRLQSDINIEILKVLKKDEASD